MIYRSCICHSANWHAGRSGSPNLAAESPGNSTLCTRLLEYKTAESAQACGQIQNHAIHLRTSAAKTVVSQVLLLRRLRFDRITACRLATLVITSFKCCAVSREAYIRMVWLLKNVLDLYPIIDPAPGGLSVNTVPEFAPSHRDHELTLKQSGVWGTTRSSTTTPCI